MDIADSFPIFNPWATKDLRVVYPRKWKGKHYFPKKIRNIMFFTKDPIENTVYLLPLSPPTPQLNKTPP